MILRESFNSHFYYDIYGFGLYLFLLYVGPLSMLIYMTVRLIQAIRYSRRRHLYRDSRSSNSRTWSPSNDCTVAQSTTPGAVGSSGDRNATVVLIIIVAVFIVCETPELVNKLVNFSERKFENGIEDFATHTLRMSIVSELLMVVNSSVNFVIYVAFGRRFRRILRETFRFSFRFSASSTSTTRASPQGAGGGGAGGGGAGGGPGAPWQQAQQYHHNCAHATHRHQYQQQQPIALRP
jgi:uncharacterized membrane protein YgcG